MPNRLGAQGAAEGYRRRDCALAARWRGTPQHCVRDRLGVGSKRRGALESSRAPGAKEHPLHPLQPRLEVLCYVGWIKTTPIGLSNDGFEIACEGMPWQGIRGPVHEHWCALDLERGLSV